MNYALQGTAPHLGRPSIATGTRRHSLSGVRAAWSRRRRTGGLPGPRSRESASSGVSPMASGASRGVALLISR